MTIIASSAVILMIIMTNMVSSGLIFTLFFVNSYTYTSTTCGQLWSYIVSHRYIIYMYDYLMTYATSHIYTGYKCDYLSDKCCYLRASITSINHK